MAFLFSEKNEQDILVIASTIAWMYNFHKIDTEELAAAVRDLTLSIHVESEYLHLVYLKYMEIIIQPKNITAI